MALPELPTPQDTDLTADKALRPFQQDAFDPADFLNSTLPPWPTPTSTSTSTSTASNTARTQPQSGISDLNTAAQSQITTLAAHQARLSTTLTKLTDDVLRTGTRLAYEVDVLRADAAALADALATDLHAPVARLAAPAPAPPPPPPSAPPRTPAHARARSRHLSVGASDTPSTPAPSETPAPPPPPPPPQDRIPPELRQLQTLAQVRDRLDAVIKVFGSALEWPLAPSETSLTSSLISVTGPDGEAAARETRGREFAERTRAELVALVGRDASDEGDGAAAALARVQHFRALAAVWAGTGEEKARARFVDGLARLVDDERKRKKPQGGRGAGRASVSGGYGVRSEGGHVRASHR